MRRRVEATAHCLSSCPPPLPPPPSLPPAVTQDGGSLGSVPDGFEIDREIATIALSQAGNGLETLSRRGGELAADAELVMLAVKSDGYALEWAGDLLKDSFDVVMAAVTNDGYALKYASETLRANDEIIKAAVAENADAAEFAIRGDEAEG